MKNIAIVIPTYNERDNIVQLIEQMYRVVPQARIVVVDDNSPDRTAAAVVRLQKQYTRLHLIVRKKNKGRGASVMAGFVYILKKFPKTSYIIEMDSDLSHKPKDVPRLLEKADEKTIVIGSRYVRGSRIIDWPKWRLVLSRFANWYARVLLRVPIADYTMGFRCYPRAAIASLDLHSIKHTGFITLSETAYKLHQNGFLFREIPITLHDRTKGRSNATFGEVLRSFVAVVQIRFYSPDVPS